MPFNHLILCCPLLLLPSIFPSIRIFSNELALRIRWPKYWSFSFTISPSKEYSGLISFRMDWLDLLAVQGTLKSLLQHHRSRHQFFSTQPFLLFLSTSIHDYWKNHSFDYMNLYQLMSFLFNTLFKFVIAFLPRSKHLLISWLQSPSVVILESKKIKSVAVSIVSPSICHEHGMGLDVIIIVF